MYICMYIAYIYIYTYAIYIYMYRERERERLTDPLSVFLMCIKELLG